MTTFTAAAVQLRSTTDPKESVAQASALIREAAASGADYVQTPEMTNILQLNPKALFATIEPEQDNSSLEQLRALAAELGIWLHIGSMSVRLEATRAANRAFLIAPSGIVVARYDKIHMFDVDLAGGESYRESRVYRQGDSAVLAELPWCGLGFSICYDVRFPHLYRSLAQAGAHVLAIPAAFTRQTGEAHWHTLQRARAIENGCFVVAAAQGGTHADGRTTFGHSLIVDPWGNVIAEADNDEPGFIVAEIDVAEVEKARGRVPSLANGRTFELDDAGREAALRVVS